MALHCELNGITEKAQDKTMQIIRLKWWYDNVMALIDGKRHDESPVLNNLSSLARQNLFSHKDLEEYFMQFEHRLNGDSDNADLLLYELLSRLIPDKKNKERFSRLVTYHQNLAPDAHCRALRLWLKSFR